MIGMATVSRMTGVSAALAGLAWTAGCLVHSSLPPGCIGDTCAGGATMRGATPASTALVGLAGLLLAASVVGLLLLARRVMPVGRAGAAAVVAGALGLSLFLAAGMVSTFGDSDWAGMPALVLPAMALLVVGLALVAAVVWRARVLPRPLSVVVLATVLLLPFANEQTSLVLLAVPFGLAWAGVGAWVLRDASRVATPARGVAAA